ncbi:hypothetical protein ACEPAF_9001 [Sanghuangporus sanghuang]
MHIAVALKTPDGETYYIEIEGVLMGLEKGVERIKDIFQRETAIPPHEQTLQLCDAIPPSEDARKIEFSPLEILSKREYSELFKRSVVYVNDKKVWARDDIGKPVNNLERLERRDDCNIHIRNFYDDLIKPRLVTSSMAARFQSLLKGIKFLRMDNFFEIVSDDDETSACASATEMECYNNIFQNITNHWIKFKSARSDSSGLLCSFYVSTLILPPFLWDRTGTLELLYDAGSLVQMFVKPLQEDSFYKYSPHSDVAVLRNSGGSLPLLISEVDSNNQKQDEVRMIFQGAVISRQWRYVLKEDFKDCIMPMGLYADKTFRIGLFLFHADEGDKVQILEKQFRANKKLEALELARCLFNYRNKLRDMSVPYSRNRMFEFETVIKESNDLPTLTSGKRRKPNQARKTGSLAPIPEHPDQTEGAVLQSAASVVCPAGTHTELTKRANVASVKNNTYPVKTVGFMKITNFAELEAFDRIRASGCKFLLEHVVLPTKSVEIFGHSVIFLPYGGEPLHTRSMRFGPMLGYETSIAMEMLKTISHLHEIRIAHLDIKPGNILWDRSTHTVRVIDFDSSWTFQPEERARATGVSGTKNYIAPEVESSGGHEYDPFLADAYGCGKVLKEMVDESLQSDEKELVRCIAEALTMQESQRWTVSKALDVLTGYVERRRQHKLPWPSAAEISSDPRFNTSQVHVIVR